MLTLALQVLRLFGMGRIGTGTYDNLRQRYGRQVIGIDSDEEKASYHVKKGRKVIHGDASDYDF